MAYHHQADSRYKPLSNVCMALNAFHVYADEARMGKTRAVMAHHYCAHVRGGRRQDAAAIFEFRLT